MSFLQRAGGELVAFIARTLLRIVYRAEIYGSLPVEARGMLIISNHQSFLDGVLLGAFLPISPTYMVHSTVARQWYFRLPLKFIRHVVVDTSNPLAVKTLVNLIDSGQTVVIFPEGRITVTGSLMKIYDGPAFVAARSGCPVVPVRIEGAVYTPLSRMRGDFPNLLRSKITLTIGKAARIPMPEGRTARIRRRLASEEMRRIMQRSAFASRRQTTLFDSLLHAAAIHGRDRSMLEDVSATPVTYGTIIRNSLALGRLVSKFTAEGETVGVLMPNVNTTVFLLFAMWAMRRIPAMLNFTSGRDAVSHACRLASVKVVLTSRAFVEKAKLAELLAGLPATVLYLEDLRPKFTFADKLWLVLWAKRFPHRVRRPSEPAQPAVVLFTSGSEGMPKGVVLSHDSVLANSAQIVAAYPFAPSDKFLTALPVFHAFGLTAGVVLPLLHGTRVMLYPSPLHYRTIPEVVYDRDCTVLFSTNTFLGHYAQAAHPYDFYNLRHVVVGAEKLTEDVARLCVNKFGIRPLEGYGATECSPVIAVNTPFANRAGSVGELLPGIEAKITPVPGIEDGGLLHVRGDSIMLGYLHGDKPGAIEAPRSDLGPGWYNTGDIVTMQDHFITIQARMKRFAKIAGEMVSLEIVERIAGAARPNGVHASASAPDAARGEAILLFTQDRTLRREDLQIAARSLGASDLAVPRRIIYLDKIPLLGNGKKDYVALARMAREGVATSV